jgi:hypothetical protein
LFLFVACTFRSCWPLPAVWSKPSSRPVLLPAGQSGLCFRCQRNVQLKGQLLLSPNSGFDNLDNRLNSSWSSPLWPSAHLMSWMPPAACGHDDRSIAANERISKQVDLRNHIDKFAITINKNWHMVVYTWITKGDVRLCSWRQTWAKNLRPSFSEKGLLF